MTTLPKNDGVGDKLAPPLRQPADRMRNSAEQRIKIPADATPKVSISKLASLGLEMKNNATSTGPVGSCVQTLWFSFFFDGTGNNLNADLDGLKHSNVAKLYRVHKGSEDNGGAGPKPGESAKGIYRIYIPGVGTYFPDINDEGGTSKELAFANYGTNRLDWASTHFDEKMDAHIKLAKNPANAIVEINIAVFGFSRGSALARAFIYDFVEKRCKQDTKRQWRLMPGGYPVRIRFMGLFDTVASVGMAMAANNMEKIDAVNGDTKSHIANRLSIYPDIRPEVLAFAPEAKPGADPAPGRYDGHLRWGGRLEIPEMVEEVRHFVAGHEVRNSFPVDSVSRIDKHGKIIKAGHFYEYVYPGVHSDVGGSYRLGEGGKSLQFNKKLGLITLREMYKLALNKGVPLLAEQAWSDFSKVDFQLDPDAVKDYNYYMSKIKVATLTVGNLFNAHARLFYEWRFHSIHQKLKGDRSETLRIDKSNVSYRAEGANLEGEIKALEKKDLAAKKALEIACQNRYVYAQSGPRTNNSKEELAALDGNIADAKREQIKSLDALRGARAKFGSLPNTADLSQLISLYDRQLMLDAQAIFEVLENPRLSTYKRGFATQRSTLRPHYRILVEAYENEFIKDKGMTDETIISFFENYVHDSLAGFGKDATLPSDPRVIYLGGDEKLEYARLDQNIDLDSESLVA